MFDVWLADPIVDDRNNIEPILHSTNCKDPSIDPCGSCYVPLFSKINVGQRAGEFVTSPSFHFYEAKCVAVESDNVDLAFDLCTVVVSPDRHGEIGHDEAIAIANKELSGDPFAFRTCLACATPFGAFILFNKRNH